MKKRNYLILILLAIIIALVVRSYIVERNWKFMYMADVDSYMIDIDESIDKLHKYKLYRRDVEGDEIGNFYQDMAVMTELKVQCLKFNHHIGLKGNIKPTEIELEVGDYLVHISDYIDELTINDINRDSVDEAIWLLSGATVPVRQAKMVDFDSIDSMYVYILDIARKTHDSNPDNTILADYFRGK